MNRCELEADVRVQLDLLRQTVDQIAQARSSRVGDTMEPFDVAGFGALLMDLYSGIENILKRVATHEELQLPTGPNWHAELFNMFAGVCPDRTAAPLFSEDEVALLREYRSFRHVMVHRYGVTLRWQLMAHLVDSAELALKAVSDAVDRYLRKP